MVAWTIPNNYGFDVCVRVCIWVMLNVQIESFLFLLLFAGKTMIMTLWLIETRNGERASHLISNRERITVNDFWLLSFSHSHFTICVCDTHNHSNRPWWCAHTHALNGLRMNWKECAREREREDERGGHAKYHNYTAQAHTIRFISSNGLLTGRVSFCFFFLLLNLVSDFDSAADRRKQRINSSVAAFLSSLLN